MLTGRKMMSSSCWLGPPLPASQEVSALPPRLTGLRLLRRFSSSSSRISSHMKKCFFFCLAGRITNSFRVPLHGPGGLLQGEVERADQLVVRPGRVGHIGTIPHFVISDLEQEEGWSPLTRRGRGRARPCELGC